MGLVSVSSYMGRLRIDVHPGSSLRIAPTGREGATPLLPAGERFCARGFCQPVLPARRPCYRMGPGDLNACNQGVTTFDPPPPCVHRGVDQRRADLHALGLCRAAIEAVRGA